MSNDKPRMTYINGRYWCVQGSHSGNGATMAAAWMAMNSKIMAGGVLREALWQPRSAA